MRFINDNNNKIRVNNDKCDENKNQSSNKKKIEKQLSFKFYKKLKITIFFLSSKI